MTTQCCYSCVRFEIDIVVQICLQSVETDWAVMVWRTTRLEAPSKEDILRVERDELCHVDSRVVGDFGSRLERS
jgi:hypothetical protein